MNRRTLLRLGAGGVAAAAVGAGGLVQWRRARRARTSARITEHWDRVGCLWLLPDLRDAEMVVPDRPHGAREAIDPALMAKIRRRRRFFVSSNAQRLRGGPLGTDGRPRILAIGDSVTFGWGAADDESWPARLQQALDRRGHAVEILNAGVPSLGIEGMAAFLSQVGPELGLAGVLFCRRPYPDGPDPAGYYVGQLHRARVALPGVRFQVLLSPVSRFDPFGCQRHEAEAAMLAARLDVGVFDLTPAFRAAQGDRGCGIRVAGEDLQVVRVATGEVLRTARDTHQGLPWELLQLFEQDESVREALFFDDGHPDEEGYAVFGGAVADELERAGWFG